MAHLAVCTLAWSLFIHLATQSRAETTPINLFSGHPSEVPSGEGQRHGGFRLPGAQDLSGAAESEPTIARTEERAAATSTAAAVLPEPAAGYPRLRRREGEDVGNLPDADPPSLWLNSLDSLRCVKESTVAPGTGACDGPEAWESAHDGSRGVYFVAVGDTGELSTALNRTEEVVAAMAEVCSVVPVSFVSLLGDNFYPWGVSSTEDPKFTSHFEIPFGHPALQRVAFFPVFGNHDYKLFPEAQIRRYFSSCTTCKQPQDWNSAQVRWRFPNPWYFSRFVYKNVHPDLSAFPLVSNVRQLQEIQPVARGSGEGGRARGDSVIVVNIHLDSNILLSSHDTARKQLVFLEAVLQSGAAEADWIFVHQHHPLFTDGTLCRNIKSFQDLLLPLYLRYGVDAVFAGHEHLLSYFELDGPESVGGPIAQVISGSGSKLHREFPTCCTPSLLHKCKEDVELCRSSNCAFQRTTSGFALINLTAKEMRLLYIDANTGEVIHHSTRRSKKASRMQQTAKHARFASVPGAAGRPLKPNGGAFAYPPIGREPIPQELTGSTWPTEDVPLWGHVMVVLFLILFIVLGFVCCGRFFCNLKAWTVPQVRRYSLPFWALRRHREVPLDPHEAPSVVGSVRSVSVGREVELSTRETGLSVGSLPVVEAARLCELRRQKDQEEMPLV
ncbi:serine/threonine protein phosphatase, putative [Eimeria maxima]|uniref:Serine/threonine protein phosphatase, putative n=1 Tax=Eimeria maxima TaxID=5804 RepID=U6M2J7_EIMMA|nr:serine/threonine protein phosphatase, putative [Eimeria maxima]CDJ58457.1 serine/threonine protein phosphatase, putative [Eimeria maxima]